MTIVIMAESLRTGDAVGNDVMREFLVLKKTGHSIHLYASNTDDDFMPYLIERMVLLQMVKKQDTLVLYHHSIFWEEGEFILHASNARVILRYHNITPEIYFEKYSPIFENLSKQGRQQTRGFIKSGKIHHYIACSAFDAADLIENGAPAGCISVLAPFYNGGDFESTRLNLDLLESLLDGKINVLSVGRILPNKGLHYAMNVIDRYLGYYGNDIRFNVVGGCDPHVKQYLKELEDLVVQYNMEGHVTFQGKVSFADLHTYYTTSHVLLMMSEYEGFCLPILEAQYHKLPVIALDRCAVNDTLGGEQISFQDIDADVFAAAIHLVARDNDIRSYLAELGSRNYQRYHPDILSKQLTGIIHDAIK